MVERSEADRLQQETWLQRTIRRPEIGAFIVMIVIIVGLLFASDGKAFNALGLKNNIKIIAQFGIIATGAAVLMIAGEFDLSIGSMIGFTGMTMAMVLKYGFAVGGITFVDPGNPVAAFFIAMAFALIFGWIIGTIVVRSGLSSFIVTLAFLFFLRGVTEVAFRLINRSTQISGLPDYKEESWFAWILGGEVFNWFYDAWYWIGVQVREMGVDRLDQWFTLGGNLNRRGTQWVEGFDARFMWWIIIAGLAYYILSRTQLGNWIYATGDNKDSARANGVPVNRVKIGIFMFTAFCATMFAACQVFDTNTSDAAKGNLMELFAIAIAVVGGTLMTGGFGSILGVIFGSITVGLVANAVFFIPEIDGAWFRVFLGSILLAAVFANERIRKRITGGI
ncbi:MAG: ABC transporter permease [Pseudomonadota bacterium]